MAAASTVSTASIIDAVLGLALASTDAASGNGFSLQGLTLGSGPDGARMLRISRFEAASLRIASGPLVLEIGRLAVDAVVAMVRIEDGGPRLVSLDMAGAELAGVKLHGPLTFPQPSKGNSQGAAGQAPAGAWHIEPLAAANGTLRAEIVDAHLLFDADVSVPIRQGQVEFREVTVEHVGPDSRMGASRLGFYVDAPNGRSYLYQFTSTPVAGVEYERRGALLGPWVTDRGKVHLQAFGEWLLRQPWSDKAMGITEQARLLFDRTAVRGEVRLGDGRIAAPGVQAELAGRAEGANVVRLHSEAVGRGLHVDVDALAVRSVLLGAGDRRLACDEVAGSLRMRLFVEDAQMQFALEVAQLKVSAYVSPRIPRRAGTAFTQRPRASCPVLAAPSPRSTRG